MHTRYILLWICCLLLAACGAGPGDAARGEALFMGKAPMGNNAPACVSCHYVNVEEGVLLGPNLSNIGNRAVLRVKGQTAEEYLRLSITNPDDYLADGYQEGIMHRGYGRDLN